jgi:arabinoxylan arabinofuranohydrolase
MTTNSRRERRPLPTCWNPSAHRAARAGVRTAIAALSLGLVTSVPSPCWADNPIVQTFYTADPAPVVYGDRLYVYASHDEDVTVNDFYTMNDWRLYSTVDMVNWTDHGTPAAGSDFSWFTDNAWAPHGISRNGNYYLFVPLNNNTGAKIGVGVADNPAGPFMDPLGMALAASGSANIDPTVFIDDDGQAYMYWGNGTLRYAKLNADMTSYSGSITNVPLDEFVEGPWFYKRESLYYMVYAAGGSGPEKLSYATSDSPTGPWAKRGDVMPSGSTYTNHAGVVDYKGHSYFFYHNSALPGGNDYKRSVCVEEFTYGSDGSIPRLDMTDEGPDAIASLNPFQQVEAETIAFSSGLKTEKCTDSGGGMNVSAIGNGDYIKVKDVEFLDGVTSFEARVSASGSNAKIELHLDSQSGTLLGTCDVSGASSWTTKTCEVSGGSGKHDLFLKFTGGSGDLFKFNWWKFDGPNTGGTGGAGGVGGGAGAGGAAGSGAAAGGGAGGDPGTGGAAGSGGEPLGGNAGRSGGGGETASGGSVSAGGGSGMGSGGNVTGGLGGSVATSGGSAGAAGRGNAGGASLTGGSASSGETGAADPDESSSCGCRQVGRSQNQGTSHGAWVFVAVCALLVRRRRSALKPAPV